MFDAAILGSGPAGLLAAAACAAEGLRVACISPAPRARWERSFGLWQADGLGELAEVRYERPFVVAGGRRIELGAPYMRLDVERLQLALGARAAEAGVVTVEASAVAVEHGPAASRVHLSGGASLAARVVVDASGPASPFVARRPGPGPAFQAAWGELVEVAAHPYAPGEAVLMDFSPVAGEHEPVTFLYALPLAGDVVFFEETSLVARPAVSLGSLRQRLHARLAALGVRVRRVVETERCLIPMGLALPRLDQRTIAFGAAGSFVHPATGYQLGRAVREARPLARALSLGLSKGSPAGAARLAYGAMWPRARRRSWELHRFGMEVAASATAEELRALMRATFELPEPLRLDFLRGVLSPGALLGAMWRVFRRSTPLLRRKLVRSGMGPEAHVLLRAALSVSP